MSTPRETWLEDQRQNQQAHNAQQQYYPQPEVVRETMTILQRLTALETTIPQLEKAISALRDELAETRHLVGV